MSNMYSLTRGNEVNNIIESDFTDLRDFIGNLLDMPKQRPNSMEVTTMLKLIIETFEDVAGAYLEKARELLGEDSAHRRLQKYEQVQNKLQNHALQLSELVRPDPDNKYFPANRRRVFSRLISIVSRRISGQPFILPILGNSCKYINFNYVDGFGLLSLPPRMATVNASNRNLGILWHEAAGAAIASAKSTQHQRFEYWTNILRERLQYNDYGLRYNELYQQSLLENLSGSAEYRKAGILTQIEDLIREEIFSMNPVTVDGVGSWQLTWLSEFLEDLFFIMVGKDDEMPGELADSVLSTLVDALATTYENLRVGDPGHPPPYLRVLVAISYLCNGNETCINERIEGLVSGKDIFGLTQAKNTTEELAADRQMARIIESVCRDILHEQDTDPWLYGTEVSSEERELASGILAAPHYSKAARDVLELAENPIANQGFIDLINASKDLNALLAIEFTTNDPFPYGGTSSLPPPWSWPPHR